MKVNPDEIYNEDYFYPKFKTYTDQFGIERKYYGPSKEWQGFSFIATWVKENIPGKTLLDIGCSAGSFVSYANQYGFEAYGVDISKFAVQNCVESVRGKVKVADITKMPPPGQFDIVTALDLMEHIYTKDLPAVMGYIRNAVKPGGYFLACIATARNENEVWSHTNEQDQVPPDKTWLACSGHVNIQYMEYWIDHFIKNGFVVDFERMMKFALWHYRHNELQNVLSWGVNNVLIVRV